MAEHAKLHRRPMSEGRMQQTTDTRRSQEKARKRGARKRGRSSNGTVNRKGTPTLRLRMDYKSDSDTRDPEYRLEAMLGPRTPQWPLVHGPAGWSSSLRAHRGRSPFLLG